MRTRVGIGIATVVMVLGAVAAASAATVDEDFAFATELVNYTPSFPDLADKVVNAILLKDPSQSDRADVVRAEILIKRRQFGEAEALVQKMGLNNPKAQAINLSLGWNYFATGENAKAKEIYDGFFKQYSKIPTDPDLAVRYRDAAFRYAQMQEMMGDFIGASQSYKRVEDVEKSRDIKRSMQVSRAQMLVRAAEGKSGDEKKKLLDEAWAIAEELQWGGLDLQFVESIVVMADVELARGNREAARKVLESNMDIIKPIDEILQELNMPLKDSPMAGTRSLLGQLYRDEADKLAAANKTDEAVAAYAQALTEYYNVFLKYAGNNWHARAGIATKEIKELLETKYGKTVKIDVPDTIQADGNEFMMADDLFRQKKYDEAIAEYLKALASFPETKEFSVRAVANLLQCYIYSDNELYAKMIANYLGERFGQKDPDITAKGLSSAGAIYDKMPNDAMAKYLFDCYLNYTPDDPQAGGILYYLANKAEKAGRQEEANEYLARLITTYKEDRYYPAALSKLAWKSYREKDYAASIEGMKIYLAETPPNATRAQAMFALADSLRQVDRIPEAIRQFNELINAISPEQNNPYVQSQADRQSLQTLLENARFLLPFTMSKMEFANDAARQSAMRKMAVTKLDEFLTAYPQSSQAPSALSLKGSLQLALGDPAANETYARLSRDYPDTELGKNAQYTRISGALGIGQTDQALEALDAMVARAGGYSPAEFVNVGLAMQSNKLWAATVKAFSQVVGKTDERRYMERALYGIGEAKYELGDYNGAVEALDDLMARYPTSAMFYQAKYMQGRANLALGNTTAAKLALNDVFKLATKPENREEANAATLVYAEILESEGNKLDALANLKRLEFFSSQDLGSDLKRQQIETALLEAIRLGNELQRPSDVLDSAELFLKLFPTSPKVPEIRTIRTTASLRANEEATAVTSP